MPTDFTIGADPEFCCVDRGTLVNSNCFGNLESSFGSDGGGIAFEIRPKPSINPLEVVSDIHKILLEQTIKYPEFLKFDWISGSYTHRQSMGGHIHFGITNSYNNCGYDCCNFLDAYVGISFLVVETMKEGYSRRCQGYGFFRDCRSQNYGFEYRMPASWLSSPYISAAFLCLAKTVVYEFINNENFSLYFLKNESKIMDTILRHRDIDVLYLKNKFLIIWSEITKMKLYQKYKIYIDIIYFLFKENLSWIPVMGMKESWGIYKDFEKKKFAMDVVWLKQEENKEKLIS